MQDSTNGNNYYILQANGCFAETGGATKAPFCNVNKGLTIHVPNIANSGNNRLVFAVTTASTTLGDYSVNGYTAYPFPGVPGECPPGPYDIFEFGPNAQYDVSAVDSFGINLSFTVSVDSSTYGFYPQCHASRSAPPLDCSHGTIRLVRPSPSFCTPVQSVRDIQSK